MPSPRRLKPARYKSLRLSKPLKHPVKLPNVWKLTKSSSRLIWQHKGLFLGITIVYGLLNLILVQGLASNGTDVSGLKHTLDQIFTGHLGSVVAGLTVFAVLVGSAGNASSQTAGAYQIFLMLLTSLAVIWALRQLLAGHTKLRIRDAYYQGVYPLVPFILVLLVIGLQLLPLIVGVSLYSAVVNNGIAIYGIEKFAWGILALLLALLSLYMVCSSLFALYIVTLPEMTPMKALRSARGLVRNRRSNVLRKILYLPLVLLIASAIIMLPIIIWLTAAAQWIFFLLTMFGLVAIHTYMYGLYRELLRE